MSAEQRGALLAGRPRRVRAAHGSRRVGDLGVCSREGNQRLGCAGESGDQLTLDDTARGPVCVAFAVEGKAKGVHMVLSYSSQIGACFVGAYRRSRFEVRLLFVLDKGDTTYASSIR